MNAKLKAIWAPLLLAFTVSCTLFESDFRFDPGFFLVCLFVAMAHFYFTHAVAARYFAIHNPDKSRYWNISGFFYVPLLVACWLGFAFSDMSGDRFFPMDITYPVFGLLLSAILFAILATKLVKMDLDAVLALLMIIVLVGAVTIIAFGWLVFFLFLIFL